MEVIKIRAHSNGLCDGSVKLNGQDKPTGEIATIKVIVRQNAIGADQEMPGTPRGIFFNGLLATMVFDGGGVWLIHRPTEETSVFERVAVVHHEPRPGRPNVLLHVCPTEAVPKSRITVESMNEECGQGYFIKVERGQTA